MGHDGETDRQTDDYDNNYHNGDEAVIYKING